MSLRRKKSTALTPASDNHPATQPPPASAVKTAGGILDRAQKLQGPAVKKYVDGIRRKYPDDSPAQIITRLEKRYLTAVTGSGSAVGATAAVPGVGTMTAFGALTGETVLFLEASALLALATAEVHGIPLEDNERRKAFVMAVALGEEGVGVVGRLVGARGTGALRRLGSGAGPNAGVTKLNRVLMNKLIKKYGMRRGVMMFGKMLPAGIGAVIGGAGNRTLGRKVIKNAREAFGPAPTNWVIEGSVAGAPLPPGRR